MQLAKKAVGFGLLAVTGLALAQQEFSASPDKGAARPQARLRQSAPAAPQLNAAGVVARPDEGGADAELVARQPLRKLQALEVGPPLSPTGRLLIKFNDDVRARRTGDRAVGSEANRDLEAFHQLLVDSDLRVKPLFSRSADALARIQQKAASYSGKAQPDLAGMMIVETADGNLVPIAVARAINDLDVIEYAHYESKMVVKGPNNGACCVPGSFVCFDTGDAAQCDSVNGQFLGVGTTCGTNACGACCLSSGVCSAPTSSDVCTMFLSGTFAGAATDCSDPDTCNLGGCCLSNLNCTVTLEPLCLGMGGDFRGDGTNCGGAAQCGACCEQDGSCNPGPTSKGVTAQECNDAMGGFQLGDVDCPNIDCSMQQQPDCGVGNTGSCFQVNPSLFCNDDDCCNDVCDIDPWCCDENVDWPNRGTNSWDAWCADHAGEICTGGNGVIQSGGGPRPAVMTPGAGTTPTPSFTTAQGYLTSAGYNPAALTNGSNLVAAGIRWDTSGPPPAVGSPMPGYEGQGLDLQSVWGVGENLISADLGACCDAGGDCQFQISAADCATTGGTYTNLSRGLTIKVGVVEHAAFLPNAIGPDGPYAHEDLTRVIYEADPLDGFLIIPGSVDNNGNHGTATLGIIAADNNSAPGVFHPAGESPSASLVNQVGVVGVAPDATPYFFSINTLGGGGTADAVARALDEDGANFGPGDVLSFSIGPGGCGTLASDPSGFIMLTTAVDAGVTCVISAGNECCSLDDAPQFDDQDSGVIIAGACFPGSGTFNSYCRMPYSNFCQTCDDPSAIHISAWGDAVASTGYGDMFDGTGAGTQNRTYTASFGGTSAAAPQIAGLVCCYQGLAKMRWGTHLSPRDIRSVFTDDDDQQFQCAFQSIDDLPGNNEINFHVCDNTAWIYSDGDWDINGQGNIIGPGTTGAFPNALDDANDVINGQWFAGNDSLEEFAVLHGTLISGNIFSLKAVDGNVLRVRSALELPTGDGTLNRGALSSGEVTDVAVKATGELPALFMSVSVTNFISGVNGVRVIYLRDWSDGKWKVIGVDLAAGGTVVYPVLTYNPSVFVRQSDKQVRARVWTVTLGIGEPYDNFIDQIQVNVNSNPFIAVPGGGP